MNSVSDDHIILIQDFRPFQQGGGGGGGGILLCKALTSKRIRFSHFIFCDRANK